MLRLSVDLLYMGGYFQFKDRSQVQWLTKVYIYDFTNTLIETETIRFRKHCSINISGENISFDETESTTEDGFK